MRAARARDGDEGMAIVVALAIVMVVFLLITAVLGQALYDISQSVSARRRLEAINAAEAGLAWYSQLLARADVNSLVDPPWGRAGSGTFTIERGAGIPRLASRDAEGLATFALKVKYFSKNPCSSRAAGGNMSGCTLDGARTVTAWPSALPAPIWAIVRSTGTSGGAERTMESVMQLTPRSGSSGAYGMYFGSVCFENSRPNVQVSGAVFVAGAAPCPGFTLTNGAKWKSNGLSVLGSVQTFSTTSNTEGLFQVDKVEAAGAVKVGNGSTGSGLSNSNNCGRVNNFCILTSAKSTLGTTAITTLQKGLVTNPGPTSLPSYDGEYAFTVFNASKWGAQWMVSTGPLPSDLQASSPTIFRITGCGSPLALSGTYVLRHDVAIVSDCGFTTASGTNFIGSGAIYLVTIASACDPAGTRTTTTFTGTTTAGELFLSTTCAVVFHSAGGNIELTGAFLAAQATFRGNYPASDGLIKLTYDDDLSIGTASPTTYFLQDVQYIREIQKPA